MLVSINKPFKKDETYAIVPCWTSDGSAQASGDFALRVSKGTLSPAAAPAVREVQVSAHPTSSPLFLSCVI